jgi:hypothetical protein
MLPQVKGFSSRRDADEFMQRRQQYVLGAVHFSETPGKQLQYILQSNTSVRVRAKRCCAVGCAAAVCGCTQHATPQRQQQERVRMPEGCWPLCACHTRHTCLQIPYFKGYVQSPNDFFQLPFMSAIAREVSRHYLAAAGRGAEAAALQWAPFMAPFPHPQLSPGTSGYILPPFIFIACMFATISFLAVLVSEKESGLRQALQTMGLQQGSYWLSWWLFEAVMAAITAWCLIAFGEWARCWSRCCRTTQPWPRAACGSAVLARHAR